MGSSVASSSSATVGGIGFLSTIDPNAFASVIPQIDPMLTMGAATFGFGLLGWMVGPFVGAGVWKWRNKDVVREVEIVSFPLFPFFWGLIVLFYVFGRGIYIFGGNWSGLG